MNTERRVLIVVSVYLFFIGLIIVECLYEIPMIEILYTTICFVLTIVTLMSITTLIERVNKKRKYINGMKTLEEWLLEETYEFISSDTSRLIKMPKLMKDFKRFGAKMIPKFTVREQACGLIHYLSALEHTLKYDKLLFIKGDKK